MSNVVLSLYFYNVYMIIADSKDLLVWFIGYATYIMEYHFFKPVSKPSKNTSSMVHRYRVRLHSDSRIKTPFSIAYWQCNVPYEIAVLIKKTVSGRYKFNQYMVM